MVATETIGLILMANKYEKRILKKYADKSKLSWILNLCSIYTDGLYAEILNRYSFALHPAPKEK